MSEAKLPTEEDIAKLPRWARVAFAARCARRALPLFAQSWPDAPSVHLKAVEQAVLAAEHAAYARGGAAYVGHAAAVAASAARDVAAHAAAHVAHAAAYADEAVHGGDDADDAAAYAAYAARAARAARAASSAARAGVSVTVIAGDFQIVLDAAIHGRWNDNTPVPPSAFEPGNEPEPTPPAVESPAESPQKFKFVVEASANEPIDPQEARKNLVGLYEKMDEYCRLKYGRGLTAEEFEEVVKAGTRTPVGG